MKVSKKTRNICVIISIIAIIIVLIFLVVLPRIFEFLFKSYYIAIYDNLSSAETTNKLRLNLTQPYNFTSLLVWEHIFLEYVPENVSFENRSTDPIEILAAGKGRCEEFSILYVSACITLGYQARLVVAVWPNNCSAPHAWAEVMENNSWVHVDPTDQIWNAPSMYENCWGEIGHDVLIYAFENGKCEDITWRYS